MELLDGIDDESESADERLSQVEVRQAIGGLLGRLKERERIAVELRFGLTTNGESTTLKDLASRWGVTRQRAQQVCAGAVVKLRAMLEQSGLVPSLD